MDSPVLEMEEADEFVLVPDAADLRAYQLDEDADDHEARFLAGNSEKTIDMNYFASEPTSNAVVQCGTTEATAPSGAESDGSVAESGAEAESESSADDDVETAPSGEESDSSGAQSGAEAGSESSVDDDVETVDGGLSDEEGLGIEEEEVEVAEEPRRRVREGDHGWQQHAVGVICSVGLAAAATGLALLLGGHQQTPHRVHFRGAGDRKAAKVSAKRDARMMNQGMSVPRFEHAPAIISFGGSYGGHRF